jgi:hypothetical protein
LRSYHLNFIWHFFVVYESELWNFLLFIFLCLMLDYELNVYFDFVFCFYFLKS